MLYLFNASMLNKYYSDPTISAKKSICISELLHMMNKYYTYFFICLSFYFNYFIMNTFYFLFHNFI